MKKTWEAKQCIVGDGKTWDSKECMTANGKMVTVFGATLSNANVKFCFTNVPSNALNRKARCLLPSICVLMIVDPLLMKIKRRSQKFPIAS